MLEPNTSNQGNIRRYKLKKKKGMINRQELNRLFIFFSFPPPIFLFTRIVENYFYDSTRSWKIFCSKAKNVANRKKKRGKNVLNQFFLPFSTSSKSFCCFFFFPSNFHDIYINLIAKGGGGINGISWHRV